MEGEDLDLKVRMNNLETSLQSQWELLESLRVEVERKLDTLDVSVAAQWDFLDGWRQKLEERS